MLLCLCIKYKKKWEQWQQIGIKLQEIKQAILSRTSWFLKMEQYSNYLLFYFHLSHSFLNNTSKVHNRNKNISQLYIFDLTLFSQHPMWLSPSCAQPKSCSTKYYFCPWVYLFKQPFIRNYDIWAFILSYK